MNKIYILPLDTDFNLRSRYFSNHHLQENFQNKENKKRILIKKYFYI